jgi:hypothetical protein
VGHPIHILAVAGSACGTVLVLVLVLVLVVVVLAGV